MHLLRLAAMAGPPSMAPLRVAPWTVSFPFSKSPVQKPLVMRQKRKNARAIFITSFAIGSIHAGKELRPATWRISLHSGIASLKRRPRCGSSWLCCCTRRQAPVLLDLSRVLSTCSTSRYPHIQHSNGISRLGICYHPSHLASLAVTTATATATSPPTYAPVLTTEHARHHTQRSKGGYW